MADSGPKDVFYNTHIAWFLERYKLQLPRSERLKTTFLDTLITNWYDSLLPADKKIYEGAAHAKLPMLNGLPSPLAPRPLGILAPDPVSAVSGPSQQPLPLRPKSAAKEAAAYNGLPNDFLKGPEPMTESETNAYRYINDTPYWGGSNELYENFDAWQQSIVLRNWHSFGKERWFCAGMIGRGAYGRASLMLQCDKNENITARMVRKDCLLEGSDWFDRRKWRDDVPMEVILHHRLSKVGSDYILPFINWSIDRPSQRVTIYTDFAPLGHLDSLRAVMHNGRQEIYGPQNGLAVPSPFIWYVAYALAEAAMIMKHGSTTPGSDPNWKSIIHKDLKMDNIFGGDEHDISRLNHPDTAKFAFPFYPRPLVADFGLSFEESSDKHADDHRCTNPSDGGLLHIPPEARKWTPRTPSELGTTITSAANVWQIGCTLFALISGKYPGYYWLDRFNGGNVWKPLHFYRRDDPCTVVDTLKIDPDMRNLIQMCLEFDPKSRPTVENLYDGITKNIVRLNRAPIDWEQLPDPIDAHRSWAVKYPHKFYYGESTYKLGSRLIIPIKDPKAATVVEKGKGKRLAASEPCPSKQQKQSKPNDDEMEF